MDKKILVLGATGNTGSATIKSLLLKQQQQDTTTIIAGVRDPSKGTRMFPQIVSLVSVDYYNTLNLIEIMKDVDRLYIALPAFGSGDLLVITSNIIHAAKLCKVSFIVKLSSVNSENPTDAASRIHSDMEQIIIESGIPYCMLQPNWFHTNFLYDLHHIKRGVYAKPILPDVKHGFINTEDIGEMAATILLNPINHIGKRYILSTETFTCTEIVQLLSELIGTNIKYKYYSVQDHRRILQRLTPEEAERTVQLFMSISRGEYNIISDDFTKVTGKTPTTLRQYLIQYIH
jgi:NAD(P)H dehydrogenase (quinone)